MSLQLRSSTNAATERIIWCRQKRLHAEGKQPLPDAKSSKSGNVYGKVYGSNFAVIADDNFL